MTRVKLTVAEKMGRYTEKLARWEQDNIEQGPCWRCKKSRYIRNPELKLNELMCESCGSKLIFSTFEEFRRGRAHATEYRADRAKMELEQTQRELAMTEKELNRKTWLLIRARVEARKWRY